MMDSTARLEREVLFFVLRTVGQGVAGIAIGQMPLNIATKNELQPDAVSRLLSRAKAERLGYGCNARHRIQRMRGSNDSDTSY